MNTYVRNLLKHDNLFSRITPFDGIADKTEREREFNRSFNRKPLTKEQQIEKDMYYFFQRRKPIEE